MTIPMSGLYDPEQGERLLAIGFHLPPDAQIVFQGSDKVCAEAFRKNFRLIPLTHDDIAVMHHDNMFTVGMPGHGFVFVVRYEYSPPDNVKVTPSINTASHPTPDVQKLGQFPKGSWSGQAAIDALNDLLIRRVMHSRT